MSTKRYEHGEPGDREPSRDRLRAWPENGIEDDEEPELILEGVDAPHDEEVLPILEPWEPLDDETPNAAASGPPEVIELPPPAEWDPVEAGASADDVIELPGPVVEEMPEVSDEFRLESMEAALRPGEIVADRYEIIEPLSVGEPGALYRIVDRYIHDREALRVLPSAGADERFRRRLSRELKAARGIRHPGVAAVFDAGEDSERGLHFLTTELVEGVTLAEALRERGGRLPVWEAFDVALQLCEGLGAIHRRTVHLNLTPHNIVLQPDGAVKILDVGVAAALPRQVFLDAARAGDTIPYLAPELGGRVQEGDRRADLYSLGVVLYRMLTGTLPADPLVPPSYTTIGVPAGLDRIVLQCLRRRPEQRPKSARAVARAMRHVLVPRKTRPLLWATIATALLTLIGAGLFYRPEAGSPGIPTGVVASREMPSRPATPPPAEAESPKVEAERPVEPEPTPTEPTEAVPTPAKPAAAPAAPEPPASTAPASVPPEVPAKPVPSRIRRGPSAPPPKALASSVPARTEASPSAPSRRSTLRTIPDLPLDPREPASDFLEAEDPVGVAPAPPPPPEPGAAVEERGGDAARMGMARASALRAHKEALAIGADRDAPGAFEEGLSALNEGSAWDKAGWSDEAIQHYGRAERHFRRAIEESLRLESVMPPTGKASGVAPPSSIRRAPGPAPGPRVSVPSAPTTATAPAHSLVLTRIVSGTQAEIGFNLLGGGQRRQVFSVGDEVADGWRLESIDAARPSVRLVRGGEAVVLPLAGTPRTPAPAEEPASDPMPILGEVAAVLDDWARTAEEKDAAGNSALYADVVPQYFNASDVSRRAVYADKLDFFGKYDNIDLHLRNITVEPRDDGSVVATFDKRWDATGPGRAFSGDERQGLVLRKYDGQWKIVSEKELKVHWVRR